MPERIKHSLETLLGDVEITVCGEIGPTQMPVHSLLNLKEGSVIPVGKLVGEPLDLFISGSLLARGEVVIINDHFGIRIHEVVSAENAMPTSFLSQEKGV